MIRIMAACAGALLVASSSALGQGWAQGPDGNWEFAHTVATGPATFRCGNPGFPPEVTCSAGANAVTLTNGTSAMTVRFEAVAERLVRAGTQRTAIELGRLRTEITGGPFTLPQPFLPDKVLFTFSFPMTLGVPGPLPYLVGFETYGTRTDALPSDTRLVSIVPPVPPHPTGLRYGLVYYPFTVAPIRFEDGAVASVSVGIGIVPEPATWVLMGAGLLALAVVSKRRLRQHASPLVGRGH